MTLGQTQSFKARNSAAIIRTNCSNDWTYCERRVDVSRFVMRYVAWMVLAVITAVAKPKTPIVSPITGRSVMRDAR